jgi:hypothetical protein
MSEHIVPRVFVAEIGGQTLAASLFLSSAAAQERLSENFIRCVVETWAYAKIDISFLDGKFDIREATNEEAESYRAARLKTKEDLNPLLFFKPT